MVDYVVYGKIIIDDIRLRDGSMVRKSLGGGGPQAALGARLWTDSVGLLSRSGDDLAPDQVAALQRLQVDLSGWHRFPSIPTPRAAIRYDEQEYLPEDFLVTGEADWERMLAQPVALPPTYRRPRLLHLITEFPDEPMVEQALALREAGTLLSLEPLVDFYRWRNRDAMVDLLAQVDIVTPDWPSASGIAGSEEPRRVLEYWATLGPRVVAVRHGRHGSYLWERRSGRSWHIPAAPVTVVDPTGAGNAYGGALAAGWLESRNGPVAGCHGAVAAALLVRRRTLPPLTGALQREASEHLARLTEQVRPL